MDAILSNPIFETIICLILVYAILSIIASLIMEVINNYFQERGVMLQNCITSMFADSSNPNFGQLLYNLTSINNLKKNQESLPQYISSEMFAKGIIEVISNRARAYKFDAEKKSIELVPDDTKLSSKFVEGVKSMETTGLKMQLLNLIERTIELDGSDKSQLKNIQSELEGWYTAQMERTTGWYKSKLRWNLFFIGLVVSLALNVDSVYLFQSFYRAPAVRAQLLPIAEQLADNYSSLLNDTSLTDLQRTYRSAQSIKTMIKDSPTDSSAIRVLDQVLARLNKIDSVNNQSDSIRISIQRELRSNVELISGLGLPIGWMNNRAPMSWFKPQSDYPRDYFERYAHPYLGNVISYIIGIVITAFAIQFGAPFWFDLLLKLVNVRRAGVKPNDSN